MFDRNQLQKTIKWKHWHVSLINQIKDGQIENYKTEYKA